MTSVAPGYPIWAYFSPVLTVGNSPLLSPWLETTEFSTIVPSFKFTGGTSVITFEASVDGSTLDTDLTYGSVTSGTAVNVLSPYFRVKVVQTIADNTVTKIFMKARA